MLEQSSEYFELMRSSFLTYLLLSLSVFVALSPSCLGAKEFSAYRLQQFQLHGTDYGSSGYLLSNEARVFPGYISSSPRRCYIVKLVDLTTSVYLQLLKYSVAGILVVMPSDLSSLSNELVEQIQDLEQTMLEESSTIPTYFVEESAEILKVYETVKNNGDALGPGSSALQIVFQNIQGNGIQLVSSGPAPKLMADAHIMSIQGALIGSKADRNFPILISAHYDSISPAADLSFGADSNGSGTVALLELARKFSHLYSRGSLSAVGRPYNSLLFLLSGAGHFNYQGTQKYLEDQIDSTDNSDLLDTRLVICLESLSYQKGYIYVHLSRVIKENTMLSYFINNLKQIANRTTPQLNIEVVQKKIRTENLLSWEHEKFHLKKINAVTLSSSESSVNVKSSLLDKRETIDVDDLTAKIQLISEAIAASLYNISSPAADSLMCSKDSVSSLLNYIASQPRSAQLLSTKQNPFVHSLRSLLARYTHETAFFTMKPDKRESNVLFYDGTSTVISAYEVKPAVFDLVLSLAVGLYYYIVYFFIKNFHKVYEACGQGKAHSSLNGHSKSKVS